MPSGCLICGKTFSKGAWLKRHQNRKTSCAPILEPADLSEEVLEDPDLEKKKCRFCGRVFASYTSMRRHVRTTCRIAPNVKNGDAGMEVLYAHTLRRQEVEIALLKTQNAEMLGIMREMRGIVLAVRDGGAAQRAGGVAVQMGDGNAVVVDNRKTVNINIFGQEGLDHATVARIKSILDESLLCNRRLGTKPAPQACIEEAAQAAVLRTALLVYSDPDHPENLTCYLPNKKTNDVLVHVGEGWEVCPASLVLPPMAQKIVNTIFNRQPYENADEYGPLMKELAENEKRYASGAALRPILVRNKDLLTRALKTLPVSS